MKKKMLSVLLTALMVVSMSAGCGKDSGSKAGDSSDGELNGEITFWHSFTQGARMDVIQEAADKFMEENPGVKITIETFSWGDFYTK